MIDGEEKIEFTEGETARGFSAVGFTDLYGCECSIQLSSIATAHCIWLGVDKVPENLNDPDGPKKAVGVRMHLNATQARKLCKRIIQFLNETT